MKIVVLAAGTSTERDVSIVSGTGICKALRRLGHQAILLDVFFGWKEADPKTAFDGEYDTDNAAEYIKSFCAASENGTRDCNASTITQVSTKTLILYSTFLPVLLPESYHLKEHRIMT